MTLLVRVVDDGVDLARFDGLLFGTALDQPQQHALQLRRLPASHGCRPGSGSAYASAHWTLLLSPSARSTLPLSLRLPTTLAAGSGNSLARLGVTRTPAAIARCGCLEHVDDFQLVGSLEVLPAYRLEIGYGLHRIGSAAGDVQTQDDDRHATPCRLPLACAAAGSFAPAPSGFRAADAPASRGPATLDPHRAFPFTRGGAALVVSHANKTPIRRVVSADPSAAP